MAAPNRKRLRQETPKVGGPNPGVLPNKKVQEAFLSYRNELDEKLKLHERIFKLNRELTIASKQIISLLHRITVNSSEEDRAAKLAEAEAKLEELRTEKLRAIAEEIAGSDQHSRVFSGGVQEYIEALTFFHFLKSEVIPSRDRSTDLLSTQDGPRFPLSTADFVLGLSDLTGELMRVATNAAAAGNCELPERLLTLLRDLNAAFQVLEVGGFGTPRDLGRKIAVMRQSVCKVERLCYSMRVRGQEAMPSHLVAAVQDGGDSGQE